MEFTQQNANQNTIISYDDLTITLSHLKLKKPCYISTNESKELSTLNLDAVKFAAILYEKAPVASTPI